MDGIYYLSRQSSASVQLIPSIGAEILFSLCCEVCVVFHKCYREKRLSCDGGEEVEHLRGCETFTGWQFVGVDCAGVSIDVDSDDLSIVEALFRGEEWIEGLEPEEDAFAGFCFAAECAGFHKVGVCVCLRFGNVFCAFCSAWENGDCARVNQLHVDHLFRDQW